jgi:DNA-binding transcriptional regulator GbsR (MarR family)
MLTEVRTRLIEIGGSTSQELGAGRIVGQVLVHLYLQKNECSLDAIGDDLGLSKASISIAVRQLEQLGLVRKVWKKGDRKNYFRSAENIGNALQQGLLAIVRQRVQLFGGELDAGLVLLDSAVVTEDEKEDLQFLQQRVERAKKLQKHLDFVLDNPLVRLLTKAENE